MDKFTKVFEADMQNSLDNLTEVDKKERKIKTGPVVGGAAIGGVAGAGGPLMATAHKTVKFNRSINAMHKVHPKMTEKALLTLAKKMGKGGAAGVVAGWTLGAGASYFHNRKKNVAESVLEEVKGRIAAKKLEEGIGSTVAGLLAKVRGLKPIKKAGNVVKDLKATARVIRPRHKLYRGIGRTRFGALKANAGDVGRDIAGIAKANPYGAALVGGGALGVGGLTAWGLKRPKKSVYEGAPFDFSKLKDKKGKDKGKGGGKVPPQFAKGKDKGGDSQKDSEVNPAQEALAKAKGKAKKKGGKKGLPPEFLKNIKGGDKGTPPVAGDKKSLPDFLKKKGRQ